MPEHTARIKPGAIHAEAVPETPQPRSTREEREQRSGGASPPAAPTPTPVPWGLAGALLATLLLVLHGGVLRWPFVSDDFVFLAAS